MHGHTPWGMVDNGGLPEEGFRSSGTLVTNPGGLVVVSLSVGAGNLTGSSGRSSRALDL